MFHKVLVGYNPTTNEIISGEKDLPNDFEHWIVKFSAREDQKDAGPTEYAYSSMARSAGLEMPRTHLFEAANNDRFFGVKRFDREKNNRRRHVHSFGNLIHTDFRIPSCDYSDLFKATSILTKNHEDIVRLFRQIRYSTRYQQAFPVGENLL
nr:HipA domain-containing protein [Desulfobulbaceae bacterium]